MNTNPQLLKKGDTIGIVAPSRVIDKSQMERAYEIFEHWGLKVKDGVALYNKDGYFAGTDQERLEDLNTFIRDDSVKAIFCARGGYGMTRIIDEVDFDYLKANPKYIVGFSDITALHLAVSRLGIVSIHGLMPVQYGKAGVDESLQSLHNLLFKGHDLMESAHNPYNREGIASGQLIGGNLSLVAESLGTNTEVDTDGKILFLEEVDEYLYKIDRTLTQLRRAGKLEKLAGLVIGDFSDMKDTQIAFGMKINDLIKDHAKAFDYPVAFNLPIGHENRNLAVPVSGEAQLTVDKNGTRLSF